MRMHVSFMLEDNNPFEKDHFGNSSDVTKKAKLDTKVSGFAFGTRSSKG